MTETEQMAGDLRERVSQVVVALAGPQGLKPTAGTALLQVSWCTQEGFCRQPERPSSEQPA